LPSRGQAQDLRRIRAGTHAAQRLGIMRMPLLISMLAVAAGCGDNLVPDGNSHPDDPDNPDLPVPVTAQGRYELRSEMDLATTMPGKAGTIINYFIAATDEPSDPTKFIVEQLINQLPEGTLKQVVTSAAPSVAAYLNTKLLEVAPEFVVRVVDLGDAFGQVAKRFGTMETLDIDAAGHATKVIHGVDFVVDEIPMEFALTNYNVADIKIEGVQVMLAESGQLAISEHHYAVGYGTLLRIALDKGIVPLFDPAAQNVGDLLKQVVNCQKVGQYVYDVIGLGSPSTFHSACTAGLGAASSALYAQLARLDDNKLDITLAGSARGVDRNRDGAMDEIQNGTWIGQLSYAGAPAALPPSAKFTGLRQ
jgi:hypothetical protein